MNLLEIFEQNAKTFDTFQEITKKQIEVDPEELGEAVDAIRQVEMRMAGVTMPVDFHVDGYNIAWNHPPVASGFGFYIRTPGQYGRARIFRCEPKVILKAYKDWIPVLVQQIAEQVRMTAAALRGPEKMQPTQLDSAHQKSPQGNLLAFTSDVDTTAETASESPRRGRPPGPTKLTNSPFAVRLSEPDANRIKVIAKKRGVSFSYLLRRSIEQGLNVVDG